MNNFLFYFLNIIAVQYVAVAVLFFAKGEWQLGVAYLAYAAANVAFSFA